MEQKGGGFCMINISNEIENLKLKHHELNGKIDLINLFLHDDI